MFIIWGSKARSEKTGIVGEFCPRCDGDRKMYVVEHYKVPHIYYIPLGGGSLQARSLRCSVCQGEYNFIESKYPTILPEAEMTSSLDIILERTNPKLKSRNEKFYRLKSMANSAREIPEEESKKRNGSVEDQQFKAIFDRLAALDKDDRRVRLISDKMLQWTDLSKKDREVLIEEIRDVEKENDAIREIFQFMVEMNTGVPDSSRAFISSLLFIALTLTGGFVSFNELRSWGYGILFVVGTLAFAVFGIFSVLNDGAVRKWVKNDLVQKLKNAKIDITEFKRILQNLSKAETKPEAISTLTANADVILKALKDVS